MAAEEWRFVNVIFIVTRTSFLQLGRLILYFFFAYRIFLGLTDRRKERCSVILLTKNKKHLEFLTVFSE